MAVGLTAQERLIRFADIEITSRPGAARMVNAAKDFIQNGRVGMLAVYGGYGNGKSTLLKAIVNEAVQQGVEARYITMTEVLAYAREAFDSQTAGDSDYGRIMRLTEVPLLAVDELDKARTSEYTREVQNYLFDARYRFSHVYGTVVAWNGNIPSLGLPALASRLQEFEMVENNDADMRPLIGGNHE